MVVQPVDFKWSSHRHCIGQVNDPWLKPHALFWGLGNTPFAREAAYVELVQTGLLQRDQDQLTQSALSGWALGSADFVGGLQQNTSRRLVPAKAGRPFKKLLD
jgi:putative transposase